MAARCLLKEKKAVLTIAAFNAACVENAAASARTLVARRTLKQKRRGLITTSGRHTTTGSNAAVTLRPDCLARRVSQLLVVFTMAPLDIEVRSISLADYPALCEKLRDQVSLHCIYAALQYVRTGRFKNEDIQVELFEVCALTPDRQVAHRLYVATWIVLKVE